MHPFSKFDERIDEIKVNPNLQGWKVDATIFETDANITLTKENKTFFFGVKKIKYKDSYLEFTEKVDIFMKIENEKILFHSLFFKSFKILSINTPSFNRLSFIKPLDNFTLN